MRALGTLQVYRLLCQAFEQGPDAVCVCVCPIYTFRIHMASVTHGAVLPINPRALLTQCPVLAPSEHWQTGLLRDGHCQEPWSPFHFHPPSLSLSLSLFVSVHVWPYSHYKRLPTDLEKILQCKLANWSHLKPLPPEVAEEPSSRVTASLSRWV